MGKDIEVVGETDQGGGCVPRKVGRAGRREGSEDGVLGRDKGCRILGGRERLDARELGGG